MKKPHKLSWNDREIHILKTEIMNNGKYPIKFAFEEAAMKLPRTLNSIEKFYSRNKNLFVDAKKISRKVSF